MVSPVSSSSGHFQTNLLIGIGDSAAAFTHKIAKGLSRVLKRAAEEPVPTFGKRYTAGDGKRVQDRIGGYRVMGDKAKGVEPGFIAKRDWSATDTAKLNDAGHKFNAHAQSMVGQWLRDPEASFTPGDHALASTIKQALQRMAHSGEEDASAANQLLQQHQADGDLLATLRDRQGPPDGFEQALASKIINVAVTGQPSGAHDSPASQAGVVFSTLRDGVMQSQVKFERNHYIKLDYLPKDKSLFGSYQIPKDKARGNWLMAKLHRWFTGASAKARNEGAVREALANDLMRSLGIESQKLKIVEGKHNDGTTKLMLDGTHVTNFNDFEGKPERGERYIKDGVLVRNTHRDADARDVFKGAPTLDGSMPGLGRNKILMLLMADRDALGSKGANKGYVGNTFVGIDPGHALEDKLLSRRNDVNSDFSFKQPRGLASLGYKNFTMFDQSSLSEKMEGVRQIDRLKASGADSKLFDVYADQFDEKQGASANFKKTLLDVKTGYEGRRDAILDVFKERLNVDTYAFGVDRHSPTHAAMRDITLNLLDGLEKFTSTTTAMTKSGIELNHPQIKSPADRKEWHISQDEHTLDIVFSHRGKARDIAKMGQQIVDYLPAQEDDTCTVEGSSNGQLLTVRVPLEKLTDFGARFGREAVLQHKHGVDQTRQAPRTRNHS